MPKCTLYVCCEGFRKDCPQDLGWVIHVSFGARAKRSPPNGTSVVSRVLESMPPVLSITVVMMNDETNSQILDMITHWVWQTIAKM
jgi:hypothetical protein